MSRLARPAPARIPTPLPRRNPGRRFSRNFRGQLSSRGSPPRALPSSREDAAQARLTEF